MLGDGIRRNIATVSKEERDRFRDAILALQAKLYPGAKTDPIPGGVSYWFKQDEIHQGTHVHFCPAFLPWHRELMNRFEAMLRDIDPQLSLHYWDWTADPQNLTDSDGKPLNLFTPDFMGNAIGPGNSVIDIGDPWKTAVFYGGPLPYRDDPGGTPADPPQTVQRQVGVNDTLINPADEATLLSNTSSPDFVAFDNNMEGDGIRPGGLHAQGHSYIGGDLLDPHTSFRDPFVFLMHSNIDRLYAKWQRDPAHPERLDPAQLYKAQSTGHNGYENTKGGDRTTIDPPGVPNLPCDDDVKACLAPWWGILSPLEPWAGPGATAQTAATGIIQNVTSVRPWAPPENQQVFKDSRDPSVVIPPSYDTVPHSSYIIVNRDTFSNSEVTAKGAFPVTFPNAFSVVYEGFLPTELGATSTPLPNPPPNLPSFTFGGAGSISAVNPVAFYEDPSGAIDVPQRIMIAYDLQFANANDFPAASGGENFFNMQASLSYNVYTGTGGSLVPQTSLASTEIALVNQPNPYMIDVDSTTQNAYWLSIDTRVFQVKGPGGGNPAGSILGVTQGDMDSDHSAPFTFIQGVLSALQATPSQFDNTSIFPTDETASELELSQKAGPGNSQRVYNYAVARVRYLAPSGVWASSDGTSTGSGVSVFFRVFSTAVSGLDYDSTSGTTGNYRRTGNSNASSVPLLGIENDSQGQPETASIRMFASPRVRAASADFNDGTPITAMTTQPPDSPNIQTISGTGSENVAFFGAWLDINLASGDPNYHEFPLNADPVSPDGGPFTVATQSLQQLILGTHHCLVAEIFFWPSGTSGDPIPHESSPASSDRLAQRNLVLVRSGNPGFPDTHRVQTTFIVKPPVFRIDQPGTLAAQAVVAAAPAIAARHARRGKRAAEARAAQAAVVITRRRGPDELIIRWNNVPRSSEATFYMPEVGADEILALSALRQHPTVLEKVDAHTLRCRLSDVTFIPLPMNRKGTIAGLMSLTLPNGVRAGQVYRFSVEQYSGFTLMTLGAFQMTIPVRPDAELLPGEIRKLSVMRYIQQAIPIGSRWYSIFVRYIDQIAARVRGFGGDPNAVKPSADGSGGLLPPPVCPPPKHVRPPELFCLNVPWEECDIEGELDLKLRFRRKCK